MLSYPNQNDRGFYLGTFPLSAQLGSFVRLCSPRIGIWSAMRNSGSVMGGAINFSTNYTRDKAGGIAWSTYLIFVGFGKHSHI